MHSSFKKIAGHRLAALLCMCAFGLIAAGCHHNNLDSGFGVAWTTLTTTDDRNQFASYLVTVDSVVLNGKANGAITAVAVPELVDFTKLTNLSELWATASLPVDTYTSAIITLDYTNAQIAVMVNGAPVKVTVVDPTGAAPSTVAINANLDPGNQLVLQPTFATSNALRLAISYDISASNSVNLATSPPTLTVKPFMTVATAAADSKLIRVRGPLINSSVDTGTYTMVVRPFFDEVNSLGTTTIFNDANTVYTFGGATYVGAPGLIPVVAVIGRIDSDGGVHQVRTDADHRCRHQCRTFPFTLCRRRRQRWKTSSPRAWKAMSSRAAAIRSPCAAGRCLPTRRRSFNTRPWILRC